ncbi:hypothetical protein BGZ97_008291 [Linnemannia gamsii]|jgi:hypothetical protein|uniref:Uncharacterized protein n=1 Tax=Linnemannia gamsii TaxID=64522 RepID=A0A9P6UQK0_9FUNG|nr:hypothetical protein BGZ97_008291 [Linnemannia gamsii]
MSCSEVHTDEIALGNGCFNYPAAPTTPIEAVGRVSRSPIKSRMETSYLQNTNEAFRSHRQPASRPTTSKSAPIHLDQQAVQNSIADADAEDVQDRSPGWKLSLIKKTPIKPTVDTFWAKYPSLAGDQQQPFPARPVSMVGPWTPWTPWWLPSPLTVASSSLAHLIPSDDAPLSQSADSPLSTPQDNLHNRIDCEEEIFVSVSNLDRVNNNNDHYIYHPRGSSTSNTAVATTAATDSLDIVLHNDTVVPCSSSVLTCKKESLWSYWDVQQEKDKGQQAEDQSSTQKMSPMRTTAVASTTLLTSMELTDPLGASSPTLPTPTQTNMFSHAPTPSSTPQGGVQFSNCTEVIGTPRLQGTHSRIVEQEGDIVVTPTWTTSACCSSTTSMAGLGLGIRLPYLHDYKSVKTTTPETVAVAEAMDRIRHRVASSELHQQYSYLARSNRLLELPLRDEREKGNSEKDSDTRS